MTFPIELRKLIDGGITFEQDTDKERITKILEIDLPVRKRLEAKPFCSPFNMPYEDVSHGIGTGFIERLEEEIRTRGGNPQIVNAYLCRGMERVVSEKKTLYGRLVIDHPRVLERSIQLYEIPEEDAQKQREYICAFVSAWTNK